VAEVSWRTCAVAALCLFAAGCDRDEVAYYRVPKAPTPATKSVAMPAGMPGDVPPPSRPASGGLRWTLPSGWTESQGGQMRYASFKPPVQGKIDGSVVVLPGPAGGELANVNRWRNQIGLAPIDETALAKSRKVIQTKAGPLNVYDFSSGGKDGSRVVAGLTQSGGNTWFVKLSGDAAAVSAARQDFMKLLGSLRFE
jgi:hypothetical protein